MRGNGQIIQDLEMLHADGKKMSTTMAAVRLISNLLKDATLGPRIVPIVADEARTFGMANLFRQVGIYSSVGQLYEPKDSGSMLLPVYIFYSMFGFQRVGDLIWAAADQRARGFLIGATAGRTTPAAHTTRRLL